MKRGEKKREIERRAGREGKWQSTLRKSGFSMETKLPVCLKMPLKREIVNHFPPRRQRFDS